MKQPGGVDAVGGLVASPSGNGGRGLKPDGEAASGDDSQASPSGNGGRGLKPYKLYAGMRHAEHRPLETEGVD